MRLKAHGISDVGLVRTNNEDAWFSSPQDALFLVADGLGGHQSGEIASKEAIDRSTAVLYKLKDKSGLGGGGSSENRSHSLLRDLKQAVIQVNSELYDLSGTHELLRGMGTTLLILYIKAKTAFVCHVGDSRLYQYRHSEGLRLLTTDHLVQYPNSGMKSKEPARCQKGYLTKALGTQADIEPDVFTSDVQPGDLFLMCSDGLSDMVRHHEIEDALKMSLTIEQKVRMLVSIAKENGGVDNITVVLVEVISE